MNPELGVIGNIDIGSEQNFIGGLLQHGFKAWADIADIVQPSTLVQHSEIYKIIDYTFKTHGNVVLDNPTLINGANALGLNDYIYDKNQRKYLDGLKNANVDINNIKVLGTKLRKLEVTRQLRSEIAKADAELDRINGDERLSEIMSKVESPLADFSQYLRGIDKNGPELILKNLGKYLDELESNPVEQIGVSTGFKLWDASIGGGLIPGSVNLIGARMKVGKAGRFNTKVYTPTGPKNIQDLTIGDEVLTPKNTIAKVIAVHPQGKVPIYRISFNDNSFTDCCDNHIWHVKSYKSSKYKNVTTNYLRHRKLRTDGKANANTFSIPITKPVDFNFSELVIHPYILGVLIGDGCITKGVSFTSNDKEIINKVESLLLSNHILTIHHRANSVKSCCIKGEGINKNLYLNELRKLNLLGKCSHDKFIPNSYKYNTKESRIQLLQGLMDTDGYVDKKGSCSYSTTSYSLAKDVKEIVESLGGKCVISEKCSACNNKGFLSLVCNITFNDNSILFSLPRKLNRTKCRQKTDVKRHIEHITYITDDYATCITLDDPDGLYLTDDFIVTHNSSLADNIAYNIIHQGIDCLVLDAEMHQKQHYHRLLAKISKISINEIKTGQYSLNEIKKEKVRLAQKVLEVLPYHYLNISGQPFEETLAEAQRWILNKVKLNSKGKANPCVIILDYLKMMSEKEMAANIAEFQKLGFMSSAFINFAIKYEIPCLSFLQLNREGIKSEETSVFAGSDRILMHLSSASIFKAQSDEEIQKQREHGSNILYNRKLVCKVAREGAGHEDGDYINIRFDREICDLQEGPNFFSMSNPQNRNTGDIVPNDEEINF